MLEQLLCFLDLVDDFFWSYAGVPALIGLGLYFSFKSNWFQIRRLPQIVRSSIGSIKSPLAVAIRGVPPLYAFFASVGGCIGIGNVVGVCTAIQIGGPGALFWVWVAGFFGMLVKYAEIYLGIKYRVTNSSNGYDGGPMFYLQHVFSGRFVPALFCILLCIYGSEIYIFNVVVHSITTTWNFNQSAVVFSLLALVLLSVRGGLRRVGKISSRILPLFLILFIGLSLWVFIQNLYVFPEVLAMVFKTAFTGHAAIGGFAGSSFMIALSQGVRRACYSGDLGIGYASVIHSESSEKNPQRQACFGVFEIFLDTFIVCSISVLLILITGVWKNTLHADMVVPAALGHYFPYINLVWPLFVFLLGYSTLISYFSVGRKAALFLSPEYGEFAYFIYGISAFLFFAFFMDASHALMVMSITGMLLLIFNVIGMFKLRNEITFDFKGLDREN